MGQYCKRCRESRGLAWLNQEAWLKPYLNVNTKQSKNAKDKKDFLQVMYKPFFGKIILCEN